MKTGVAKMRQQEVYAARRERRRQKASLTAPIGAFREKEP
jgi:hypothetical protein